MKVERSRFLLLTTALAAASAVGIMATGCTVTSKDKGTTTPPVTTVDSGGTDGGGDAYYPDGGDGGACHDDTGDAPTCTGASPGCGAACEHYLPNYKKAVARDIISCLIGLPTCEGTGVEAQMATCVQLALGKACDDTTATGFCTPIAESCASDGGTAALDLDICTGLAKGLNATGRTAFTTCVTKGTAGYCIASPTTCVVTLE